MEPVSFPVDMFVNSADIRAMEPVSFPVDTYRPRVDIKYGILEGIVKYLW